MASINDKFKKVSASNTYSKAAVVKTPRGAGGGTVLEAHDLSTFPDDTAISFITYAKDLDAKTNQPIIRNKVGWIGLVNKNSNTITNLTLAPGYTDLGQQAGDFIETIPTSQWANDLVDGITTTLNQDGTLRQSVFSQIYQDNGFRSSIFEQTYPVGSIYINATNSTNPGTLLGFGTWEAFGKGRVLVGYDSGQSEFNAAEKTGGHKSMQSHNHTGTTSTNGNHTHGLTRDVLHTSGSSGARAGSSGGQQVGWGGVGLSTTGNHNHSFTTSTSGSGDAGNLQPYITVYMWKRTA